MWDLFHKLYPNDSLEGVLRQTITNVFPHEALPVLDAFHQVMMTSPHKDQCLSSGGSSASTQQANEATIDDLFLRYYVIGMRMAVVGASLHTLPYLKLISAGKDLESYPALFSEACISKAKSPQTLLFAKCLLEHGAIFLEDRVDAGNAIAKKIMQSKMAYAKQQHILLEKNVQQYENAQRPSSIAKQKVLNALSSQCVWLALFEDALLNAIETYVGNLAIDNKEQASSSSSSYFWWAPSIPYWSSAAVDAQGPLEDEVTGCLFNVKKLRCLKMIDRLDSLTEVNIGASEFQLGLPLQNRESADSAQQIFDHAAQVSNALKIIVRSVERFYVEMENLSDDIDTIDSFTEKYFSLVDALYASLKENLQRLLKEEHHLAQEKALVGSFRDMWKLLPTPQVHKQAWGHCFHDDFETPERIQALIVSRQGGAQSANAEQGEEPSPKGLAKLFSKLRIKTHK